jgi:hypothetical protein
VITPHGLDIARAISVLAKHLPDLTVVVVRNLGYEWTFDPHDSTLWVEDAIPRVWVNRVLAGLDAVARHLGVPSTPLPHRLHETTRDEPGARPPQPRKVVNGNLAAGADVSAAHRRRRRES